MSEQLSSGLGGIAKSGVGQILLPLAVGAASIVSPRIGHGISAGLGVLDWSRRKNKEEDDRAGLAELSKYLGGSTGTAPNAQTTTAALGEGTATSTPTPSVQGFDLSTIANNPLVQKSKSAQEMLARYSMARQAEGPKTQLVPTADGFASVETPHSGGTPRVYQVPGLSQPQKFGQPVEDTAFSMFGKGPYSPEQIQKVQGSILDKTIAREDRNLDNYFTRLDASNAKNVANQMRATKSAQDRNDLTQGRPAYQQLNRALEAAATAVQKDAQKQLAEVAFQPVNRREALIAEINSRKEEQLAAIHDDYLTQVGDFKKLYPNFPTSGNDTPSFVSGLMEKRKTAGAVDETIMKKLSTQDAADYQTILRSGDKARISEARRRALKATGTR